MDPLLPLAIWSSLCQLLKALYNSPLATEKRWVMLTRSGRQAAAQAPARAPVGVAGADTGADAHADPAARGEVGGLGAVVAVVEARVVRACATAAPSCTAQDSLQVMAPRSTQSLIQVHEAILLRARLPPCAMPSLSHMLPNSCFPNVKTLIDCQLCQHATTLQAETTQYN